MKEFVFFVVLLAWNPLTGEGTPDSGHFADPTLSDCHARTQKFSNRHNTPLQLCVQISKAGYDIIQSREIEFVFNDDPMPEVEPDKDDRDIVIARLREALRAIGRLHRGKTRDSQRVRAIIRSAR